MIAALLCAVSLIWDPSPGATGYLVYSQRAPSEVISIVTNVPSTKAVLTLRPGTYLLSVSAYNILGLESTNRSNEVLVDVPYTMIVTEITQMTTNFTAWLNCRTNRWTNFVSGSVFYRVSLSAEGGGEVPAAIAPKTQPLLSPKMKGQ